MRRPIHVWGPAAAGLAIMALGTWFRLDAVDWDSFAGLHPDERFLIFQVSAALAGLEETSLGPLALWFDTAASPLNPRNHTGFYVYGELPHLVLVLTAEATGTEGWENLLALGRGLAGLADALTILAAFLIGARWGGTGWHGVAAAAFYAGLPVAVQGAHFFTVDPFLGFFVAVTLAGLSAGGRAGWAVAGVAFGLALACKISALAILPVFLVAAWPTGWAGIGRLFLAALTALLALRLGSPFSFEGLLPDPRYLDDLRQLAGMAGHWPGSPPNWSWVGRTPVLYPLRDLVLFGFAPGLALALALGILRVRRSAWIGVAALVVVLGPMLVHAAPAMRYALPAGAAAAGLAALARPRWLLIPCLAVTLTMGDAVRRMLALPHPRVAASHWIWANLPPGSLIVNETAWDEGLPAVVALPGETGRRWPFTAGGFEGAVLELTDAPSPEKVRRMADLLARADLLVESSRRMSGTIPRLGGHRPVAEEFYRLRDTGALCYEEVAGFRRGLPVLGLFEIDDSFAQEIWTVYDHPEVRLFRRLPCFDRVEVEAALMRALPR